MELKFQENFLWGAATSGPQTEGRFKKQHDNVFDYDFDHYQERFWAELDLIQPVIFSMTFEKI